MKTEYGVKLAAIFIDNKIIGTSKPNVLEGCSESFKVYKKYSKGAKYTLYAKNHFGKIKMDINLCEYFTAKIGDNITLSS
jgi:hypothetical protein